MLIYTHMFRYVSCNCPTPTRRLRQWRRHLSAESAIFYTQGKPVTVEELEEYQAFLHFSLPILKSVTDISILSANNKHKEATH